MPSVTFRIIDVITFEVLADVTNETAIEDYLLANNRYNVKRKPFKGVIVVYTAAINLDTPGS